MMYFACYDVFLIADTSACLGAFMSVFRSNKVVCDFCGKTLHEHEIQCYNSNNYEPMVPVNNCAVQLHAVKVDLCHSCIAPLQDVFMTEFKKHKEHL